MQHRAHDINNPLLSQKLDHSPFLEFQPDPEHAYAFNMHQLIHYSLERAISKPSDAPPLDRVTLAFSTADVTLVGWRFERLCERLRAGEGGFLRALPSGTRYSQLEAGSIYVTSITIEPIKEK